MPTGMLPTTTMIIMTRTERFISRRVRTLRQVGLSLVELMVGLTIGLVLTLGLFTLISSQSMTFKIQDDFARMQENGTLALRYLGDSVRMAGFYAYSPASEAIDTAIGGVATTTDCGSAGNPPAANWALAVGNTVQGFDGLMPVTVNAVLPCILAVNFVAGPILVTRSAGGFRIPDPNADGNLTDGLTAQPNYTTTIYVQSDPNAGLLFYGANFAALKAAGTTRSATTGADLDIFEYRAQVYYIRPCSRPNGGAANCTGAADDGGQPIPTLVRQELVGSVMTEVPLVEGIEQINFQYGIDDLPLIGPTGGLGDGVPDRFTPTPTAAEWPNVVAVKVTLLVRSPGLSREYDDSTKSYDLTGDGNPDFTCAAGPNCWYKRKVFSQIFQIRNIAQRRGA